ncbi:25S rRNA (uracil(2634)-N(3))-methyltransferase [Ranunculus cassubicifolius]
MANDEEFEEESEEDEVKWLKYYSSIHQILLVGDGDFSFSLSLANSFGSASNIVATSLDSHDTLVTKYSKATSNIAILKKLGATVIHGVDATKMKLHPDLKMRKFDRIIYNFPHAGFHGKEEQGHLIKMHRNLVQGFFKNASGMLRPYGEVHVNHKTTAPFNHWNLEELASYHLLGLIECMDFKKEDYPGYNNKRGDGARSDEPFPLGECSTFKFKIFPNMKKKKPRHVLSDVINTPQTKNIPKTSIHAQYPGSLALEFSFPAPPLSRPFIIEHSAHPPPLRPQHSVPGPPLRPFINEQPLPAPPLRMHPEIRMGLPLINNSSRECLSTFPEYFRNAELMFGRSDYNVREAAQETLDAGFERCMRGAPGRDMNRYIVHLEELRQLSELRVGWLRSLPFRDYY